MKATTTVFSVCSMVLFLLSSCKEPLPESVAKIYDAIPNEVDYNFHVRPILSDKCFSCHGPDANTRKADLRLDLKEEALGALKSQAGFALVAGSTSKSHLIKKIFSEDPEEIMPPPEVNLSLTAKEKAILYKWVDQGAKYKNHWAFASPVKSELPELTTSDLAYNPIDHFVIKGLKENKLSQSKPADKTTLLRRVSMDLTGLPPTLEQIEQFSNDTEAASFENLVDQLLASPAYGERMAMEWMDVARYADSHGLHADGYRMMWPWRDWVINSFNKNLSYKDFITWQMAGDLMSEATDEQKLATAFNRNHTMTAEGGAIDEEFRLNYVFDRTETFSTAMLGLTVGCARCHDHKFDPISQKEFYQLTAFFNQVDDLGMTGDDGNYGPMLSLYDQDKADKIHRLNQQIISVENDLEVSTKELTALKDFINDQKIEEPISHRIHYSPLDNIKDKWIDGRKLAWGQGDNKVEKGINGNSFHFTGEYDDIYLYKVPTFELHEPFSGALWARSTKKDGKTTQTLMGTAGEKNNFWRGWEFWLDEKNRLCFSLIHSLPHNYLRLKTIEEIEINKWNHLAFSYNGNSKASGVDLFINGKKIPTEILFDELYKSIIPVTIATHKLETDKSVRVGRSWRNYTGETGTFLGNIDEIKIFNKPISESEVIATAEFLDASIQSNGRDHQLKKNLAYKNQLAELRKVVQEKLELNQATPEVMVMKEMTQPRKTFLYNRGEYDQPTSEVNANTPEVLPNFSNDYSKNRLGLSNWTFDKDNPLTARVTVNRYWQMIFGRGLVESANDFGLQGSLPSHPQLLDYLAIEFQNHNWDLKWLIKEMVTSYTYQQSSKIDKTKAEIDPQNIYLSRAPSYRLQAEMIRDNALAASGLLVNQIGGESVKPYQPEGLWIEKSSFSTQLMRYEADHKDSLYRRSLYTFIRRTSPHPAMTIFDAPNREICTVKRENTSTPLQALVLLNDPQFVEAARVLAERVQHPNNNSPDEQIQEAFKLTLGRAPNKEELRVLNIMFNEQLEKFTKDKASAEKILAVGEFPLTTDLDKGRTAALTMIASTLINHNEAYIKR